MKVVLRNLNERKVFTLNIHKNKMKRQKMDVAPCSRKKKRFVKHNIFSYKKSNSGKKSQEFTNFAAGITQSFLSFQDKITRCDSKYNNLS